MSGNDDVLLMLIERTRVLGDEVRALHFEVLALEDASVGLSGEASVLCAESFKLLESLQKVTARKRAAKKRGAGVPMGAPDRTKPVKFVSDQIAEVKYWIAHLIIITIWVSLIFYWAWQK